jgi:hypothetical protein
MRHSRRYCIGGMPTFCAKRSANTARDMYALRASDATVHRRATSTWMSRECTRQRRIEKTGEQSLLLLRR